MPKIPPLPPTEKPIACPESLSKCVACEGTGRSSKGSICVPCNGTGRKNQLDSLIDALGVRPKVLALCDYSGIILKPWYEYGFDVIQVDLQHKQGEYKSNAWPSECGSSLYSIGQDVRDWEPNSKDIWVAVFAFPPCTHLAVSGARWFKSKGLKEAANALLLVDRCREIAENLTELWFLENPVSTLATYWRKPDHVFDPIDYSRYQDGGLDAYTKKTCLWVGSKFIMPPKKAQTVSDGSKMHTMAPSLDRANLRSQTPMGFARAVFQANLPVAISYLLGLVELVDKGSSND